MSRGKAKFRQSDVTRVLKGAEAAGVKLAVEIAQDGTLRFVPAAESGKVPVVRPEEIVL